MEKQKPLDETSHAVQTHLSIIQDVIQRMGANSAMGKGWCIALVSAVLVLVIDKDKADYVFIAFLPIVLFAALDAYYLGLERCFRESYKGFVEKLHVSGVKPTDVYGVSPCGNVYLSMLKSFGSFSIWPFYGSLVVMVLLVWKLLA